jgi:arabinofuranosyltransferase
VSLPALSSSSSGIPPASQDARVGFLVRASLLLLFTYVFLANAWLGDDAYITFREVWNFVHGYGLTFNPDERVYAYTNPLWVLAVAAAHAVTREFFFTATALSWVLDIAAVVVLVRWARSLPRAALIVVWLLSSKAFVDYTSSGLEYPMSYLLIALFYTRYLERRVDQPASPGELRWFALLAALGFLTRPDAILLYVVPLAEMTLWTLDVQRRRTFWSLAAGFAPAVMWVVFTTFYYGFPLPNTYYAKVASGIPGPIVFGQGVAYVLNSVSHDPVTLGTIALAVASAVRADGPVRRAAGSAALYVAYTVSVGGDFMSGRFFALPLLMAVMTLVPQLGAATASAWAAAALLVYNLLAPLAPIKTTSSYDAAWPWRTQNGIKDERGNYHQATNPLFFSPFRALPDHVWVREGLSFRSGSEKVIILGSTGFFGMFAGPEKFLIDRTALSDPLLARLPVSPRLYFEFYAGHYFRDMPDGYVESCARDENLLTDPVLHEYYDRLRNVTRGSLFRASRLRDIWTLNIGRYRNLHEAYEKRRPIVLSIRADNERFATDVGQRDPVAGALRTTGRAGYLQLGPGIPLKAGTYRARWIGTVAAAPDGHVGFVEVWTDRRLDRQPVTVPADDSPRRLAQVDFELTEAVGAVDYRFYVNSGVQMTLERVELYSGAAIPLD